MENDTWSSRAQLIVIVRTTTSTLSFCRAAIRWLVGIARKITLSGLPRMSLAMARTRSMSKPSRFPDSGLRKPHWKLFWSTPAISLPRSLIRLIASPSARPGGRLASGSVQSSARAWTAWAVPDPVPCASKASLPLWESGSRVSDAVTAQAAAMAVTPPQPRSRCGRPPRAVPGPVLGSFAVIAPPVTGTPRACG